MIDFKSIAARALSSVDVLLPEWLPGGVREGHEYKALNPTRSDARRGSFSVNMNTGAWADFATGDKGGDLISLYGYLNGLDPAPAAKALAERLGVDFPQHGDKPSPAKRKGESEWTPVLPVPDDAPEPPKAHVKRGVPTMRWAYRDEDGRLLGWILRFTTSDGGKEILPLVFAQHAVTGSGDWRWLSFPQPRPLYGLDRLAAKPDAKVLLVEGEKCADAAAAQLPNSVVVTWPGGAQAIHKVDWSPLAGRRVIIWPDADAHREKLLKEEKGSGVDPKSKPLLPESKQPGMVAAESIAAKLLQIGCKVRMVKIPLPGEKPDGWDVADLIDEGVTGDALSLWIQERLRTPTQEEKTRIDTTPASAGNGDWREELLRKEDKLLDYRDNIYLFLKNHPALQGVLWTDEFAHRVVRRRPAPWEDEKTFKPGAEWTKHDDLRLGMWLAQHERLIVRNKETLADAVGWAANELCWHPVREYLDGLRWDGIKRIDVWLSDFLGVAKTRYTMAVARMFLIGMVARIYAPGCMMRAMPILEGAQFQGKSTALRILGGDWFGDTLIDLNNKDAYQLIQGCWLYEISELDAFSRAETTRIKAFISSVSDRFRAPYDREPRDWLRQTVFAGTTNQDEYFKDATGNTRYWPVRVQESGELINLDGLAQARDQLFAEAVYEFKNGSRWHPTREEQQTLFEPEQNTREIIDAWLPVIDKFLRRLSGIKVTLTEILTEGLKVEVGKIDGNRQMATRVGNVMRQLGWKKKRETGGARNYFYERPKGYGDGDDDGNTPPF